MQPSSNRQADPALSVAAQFNAQAARHPNGSQARKLLAWAAIELPDRGARIAELEEDEAAHLREAEKLREVLCTIKAALEVVSAYASAQAFALSPDTFARDFAPFINIMAAHGVPPYAKQGRQQKPTSKGVTP